LQRDPYDAAEALGADEAGSENGRFAAASVRI
jgi:hypothetical protein